MLRIRFSGALRCLVCIKGYIPIWNLENQDFSTQDSESLKTMHNLSDFFWQSAIGVRAWELANRIDFFHSISDCCWCLGTDSCWEKSPSIFFIIGVIIHNLGLFIKTWWNKSVLLPCLSKTISLALVAKGSTSLILPPMHTIAWKTSTTICTWYRMVPAGMACTGVRYNRYVLHSERINGRLRVPNQCSTCLRGIYCTSCWITNPEIHCMFDATIQDTDQENQSTCF